MRGLLLAWLVMASCASAQEVQLGQELLRNGSFELPGAGGDRPADWSWNADARWDTDGQNRWITEEAVGAPASISIGQTIPLQERFWKLSLSCRVRFTDVAQGTESWHDARIAMQFQDDAGQMVGPWPNVLHFTGSSAGWETHEREYIVPAGARKLSMSCSLFSTTGKVEWDDVSVNLLKTDPVPEDATLPPGVVADWDLAHARKWVTSARARVCINGLWRFHPVELEDTELPAAGTGWGYYKVPGSWAPGTADMTPFGPDIWEERLDLSQTDAAWYERRITIPKEWAGRRVLVSVDNPKQSTRVLVDGKEAGRIDWPGGRLDITSLVRPGSEHTLSVYVLALPLEQDEIRIAREDLIETVRKEVRFRGLCGDCYLEAEPTGPRIQDVFLKPSVRRGGLEVVCELAGSPARGRLGLRAKISEGNRVVKVIEGATDAAIGTVSFFGRWEDPKLWELDRPNLYEASVELIGEGGKVLDATLPVTFGFREFRIEGKDFLLNGRRIHLRCLDLSNHTGGAGAASYDRVREAFRRARGLGFNYVIHAHYDSEPQSFLYIDDVLRAGDEAGFPMSYSLRHVKREYREFDDPGKREYWNRVVDYEVRRVRNHPSVFMWAMNHNFTGWADDQNPAGLTGKYEPKQRDDPEMYRRRHAATVAEQYVMALDGTRPCYHHQSGPLNQMTTLNCYLCFTPLQERIEWLSRWAKEGVKPLFFVEFGLPHHASWGGHRLGPFVWTNAVSPEPLVQEFGAIYHGDEAYALPDYAEQHYDEVARVYARGEPFHLHQSLGTYWGRRYEHNFLDLKTLHTLQTWPAFRTDGVSAILPWDQADLYKTAPEAKREVISFPTDWMNLQRPGLSPDRLNWTDDWLKAPELGELELTSTGQALARVNADLLAYIAGPKERFTAKDHLFASGETVRKQLAFINDARQEVSFAYRWTAAVTGGPVGHGDGTVRVAPGDCRLVPVQFAAPAVGADSAGEVTLEASVEGQSGDNLADRFGFTVLARQPPVTTTARVALYDPRGETARALREAGLEFRQVSEPAAPEGCSLFIVGKQAMGLDGPGIDVLAMNAARANVLVCEQSEEVLQRRWGFRTAGPGVRRAFVRQPGHPVCRGLSDELLRDWRGSSSLLEAYPAHPGFRSSYPMEQWCGFSNSRTWQWGNYGTVASVVIEKPQRGNFSVILDCEFDQQYTPLWDWLTPSGRVTFCQLDLCGRDQTGPEARRLLANLLCYAQTPVETANPSGPVFGACRYIGNEPLRQVLEEMAVPLGQSEIVILGPGAEEEEAKEAVAGASTVICLGLDGPALSAVLPFTVTTEVRELTHASIGRPTEGALVGLGNCDFHWRMKTPIPAITSGPQWLSVGPNGIFAEGRLAGQHFILMQSTPLDFDGARWPQLRRTWRHSVAALSRVLTHCGVGQSAPVAARLQQPAPVDRDLSGKWRFTIDPEKALSAEVLSTPGFDDSSWRELAVPGAWEPQGADLKDYDGVAWYRLVFTLAELPQAEGLRLDLGAVDDEDWTYLNGKPVGYVGHDTNPDDFWEAPRRYPITREMLRQGRNVLVVRVSDDKGGGGIMKGPVGIFEPGRWLESYYLDAPEALDDPYRYNRW